jgi:HEAT repeat protein
MATDRAVTRWTRILAAAALALAPAPLMAQAPSAEAPPLSNAGGALQSLAAQTKDAARPEAERIPLIEALGQWETEQVRPTLLDLLADPLPGIRAAAARALGWRGNVPAISALRARAEAPDEDKLVRASALEALGKVGDESVRGVLETATKDPDAKVREAALRGLGLNGLAAPEDRTRYLRELAAGPDFDLLLRVQAIQGLAALKDTGATGILVDLIDKGPRFPMPNLSPRPSQPEVMLVRFRQARDVKAWSARALGILGAKSALPQVLKAAEDPDDFFLRMMAIEVLGYWKAQEAVPVLLRRLDDKFEYARVAALWSLGEIGDKSTADAVLVRLTDREPKVRAQAAKTLAAVGDARMRQQLEIAQGRDPDPEVQAAVAEALEKMLQ